MHYGLVGVLTMEKTLFKNILKDLCAMAMYCPVTGEILDYRHAVILKKGSNEKLVSKNGLKKLIKLHGDRMDFESLIQTPETYFKEHNQ